jgi:peptide/nickel transport system ATP-binding protein
MAEPETLLHVEELHRTFDVSLPALERLLKGKKRATLKAVDGISFTMRRGETFALVGESGCGKSTVARLVVGLYRPTAGRVVFAGQELARLRSRKAAAPLRRRLQMIFQDPYASLNPRWRVKRIIAEPLRTHRLVASEAALRERVAELLTQVRLSPADGEKFPHEFSGGQRQRISIARALASNPEFLVCDEPTSALDVSVQAQILNLMKDLQRQLGLICSSRTTSRSSTRCRTASVSCIWGGSLRSPLPNSSSHHRATPTRACCSIRFRALR